MAEPGKELRDKLRQNLRARMDGYCADRSDQARAILDEIVAAARATERADVMIVVHRQIHSSHFMRVQQRVEEDAKRREAEWKNG
jgi:hypothetical protein